MNAAPLVWSWLAFSVAKRGNAPHEYEDAWAVDAPRGRFAIADGATESSFAGLWARSLAEAYVAADAPSEPANWLPEPRRRWAGSVMGLELPWYAEMKREEGAFATFVGVDLRPDESGRWSAVAVGDSCLIRLRGERLRSFPVRSSADFDNRPSLLGSRTATLPKVRRGSGRPRAGDRLVLATDALAQWFLRADEEGRRPWPALFETLAGDEPGPAFVAWVEGLRDSGELRNDDVTLLAVEFRAGGPQPFTSRRPIE